MPPLLALLITCCFIAWLLRKDLRTRRAGSLALLVPAAWVAIASTRPVSTWFEPQQDHAVVQVSLEGAPINTYILGVLMVGAIFVLNKRNLNWGEVFWLRHDGAGFSDGNKSCHGGADCVC